MTYAALLEEAQARHLDILGGFHPEPDDGLPPETRTLLLLGPHEPAFWPAFTQSPEWQDGRADPVDRWSKRVIGEWAEDICAAALFPFGGPPYLPFYSWALRTGRTHASPVKLLVHDRAGLFVSFRGALALPRRLTLPIAPPCPCESCADQPCRSACPASALTSSGYDVLGCRQYLETEEGAENMQNGCAVRRACPVSRQFGRDPEQSAYHMAQFKAAAQ
jgi:hypothetical protein